MSFKKSLKTKIGQAALEYFILFSIIAALSILSLNFLYPKVREALQGKEDAQGNIVEDGFFQMATQRIADSCVNQQIE